MNAQKATRMLKAVGEGPRSEAIAAQRTPCEMEELLVSLVWRQWAQRRSTFAVGVALSLLCFMRQWSASQEGKLQVQSPHCGIWPESCVVAGINYNPAGPR